MSKSLVIYGGSFNPPGLRHRRVAEALARQFDTVIVAPRGPRADRPVANDVEPIFRATLVSICFADLPGVEVDLTDLEQAACRHTGELDACYAARGTVWHLVGADAIAGGAQGASSIQQTWHDGPRLWDTLRFAVARRAVEENTVAAADLPPHHRPVELPPPERSSAEIRDRIFQREAFAQLVTPEVTAYIDRYGLYRGRVPNRVTRLDLAAPRWQIVADERNPRALHLADKLRRLSDASPVGQDGPAAPGEPPPNAVLAIGGDGTMLRAIRQHWQKRIPFFGVNAGHLGFLLNDADTVLATPLFNQQLVLRQMPLLYVETQAAADEPWTSDLAFNDAWIERSSSQSAWLEVSVGEQVRLKKMVCDGALLSTASGSTAYARSMGATPLLADTPAWLLVGSNVMHPAHWKSALLGVEQEVTLRNLDVNKRPLCAYVDGISQGPIQVLRARMSRTAAVELAFLPSHDMAEKIAQIQFPRTEE